MNTVVHKKWHFMLIFPIVKCFHYQYHHIVRTWSLHSSHRTGHFSLGTCCRIIPLRGSSSYLSFILVINARELLFYSILGMWKTIWLPSAWWQFINQRSIRNLLLIIGSVFWVERRIISLSMLISNVFCIERGMKFLRLLLWLENYAKELMRFK